MINVTFTLFAYLMASGVVVFCCEELHLQGSRTKKCLFDRRRELIFYLLRILPVGLLFIETNGQVNCNEKKNCKHKVSQITVLGKAHVYIYNYSYCPKEIGGRNVTCT
jgi:hypothetical protein